METTIYNLEGKKTGTIKLPENLAAPGLHLLKIGAKENLPSYVEGTGISARTSVESLLKIFVPHLI